MGPHITEMFADWEEDKKTIVVIGGSGGIGKELCGLLKSDYNVFPCSSKTFDVRNFTACKSFFETMQVDIVINASGVNHDRFLHKVGQEDQYKINHLLDVNLHGALNIASACLPGMRERGYGRIIMISSVLSTLNVKGAAMYSACKAFIDRLVKSVSDENITKGITANSIQLGYFDAGMTYKLPDAEKYKAAIPLKRWGKIEELANAVKFLIQTEYCTGVNLPLTGGL